MYPPSYLCKLYVIYQGQSVLYSKYCITAKEEIRGKSLLIDLFMTVQKASDYVEGFVDSQIEEQWI